ncbi:MAG TPA: hypothetical protein VF167_19310 [Longimicrobiaceae bacterium]
MNLNEISAPLTTLLSELVDGAPVTGAYILNRGDQGLLRSLDRLSAEAASSTAHGGASIAAHTDHLRFGLSLMNRWASGEDPFADADWGVSWRRTTVTPQEWDDLRTGLRTEAHRWLEALRQRRELDEIELTGVIASIAHLAYHVGAIRQIDRAARGPSAEESKASGAGAA